MEDRKIYSRDKLLTMMDQNEDEVNELMKLFIQFAPTMIADLREAMEDEDWSKVAETAHKLKSSMRLWDMHTLDDDVVFIETHAHAKTNLDEVRQKLNALCKQLDEAIEQMRGEIV